MPSLANTRVPARSGLWILVCVMAFVGLCPFGAGAQSVPAPAATGQPDAAAQAADDILARLLDVLQDDAQRAALVARLDLQAATGATDSADDPAVARQLADGTLELAATVRAELAAVWRALAQLPAIGNRLAGGQWVGPEAWALALTMASTIGLAMAFGGLATAMARRLQLPAAAPFWRRAQNVMLSALLRLVGFALAWMAGLALATLVFSANGAASAAQGLYLNAFAAFGLFRVVLRLIANPDADREPALTHMAPAALTVIHNRLRGVGAVVIYGFLFLLPLANQWFGFATVRPLRTLVATLAAVLALIAVHRVWSVLDRTGEHRLSATGPAGAAVARGTESVLQHVWPPIAVGYVLYAWFIALTRPGLLEDIVLGGTFYSAVAVLLLLAALRLLRATFQLRAPMPAAAARAMPEMQPRADLLLRTLTGVAAAALAVVAVVLAVSAWGWSAPSDWLQSGAGQEVIWHLASALLVAALAALFWVIVASWIDRRLNRSISGSSVSARSRTLLALFRNAFTIAFSIVAVMITLSQLGVDIAPLLAGAGVLGLAIGFGAQKLVQDIITGIFIQLENAINEGDVVGVAGVIGGVERLTIRSVRLRTMDGASHIIPFSSVDTVTNLTRDFGCHVADLGVAYDSSIPAVKAAMEEAYQRLAAETPVADILSPIEIDGVVSFSESAMVVRGRIKTMPGKQWGVGRRYSEIVKEVFDEQGIEIPYPRHKIDLPEGVMRALGAMPGQGPPAEPFRDRRVDHSNDDGE